MDASLTPAALRQALLSDRPPLVIDVRRGPAFLAAPNMIRGALRRDPDSVERWKARMPKDRDVVVYCVHGLEVSRRVAHVLGARFLQGGIEAWDGQRADKPAGAPTRWITRERPKIDRVACPWLIRRFIDEDAQFLYVPKDDVGREAAARGAIPYDVPDVEFTHVGGRCSFDAFIYRYRLTDAALIKLSEIVRSADTNRPELAPESVGLVALSIGLSALHADDHEMLEAGMPMYDALYAWCAVGPGEVHTWNPAVLANGRVS
ncbi:MAG: chromate resistance protein ChrB domain-containing protein [Burkholderiales bacterium]